MGYGEEDHKNKLSFSSYHSISYQDQHDSPFNVDLDHVAEVVVVSFLHCVVTFPTSLPLSWYILHYYKGNHFTQTTLTEFREQKNLFENKLSM